MKIRKYLIITSLVLMLIFISSSSGITKNSAPNEDSSLVQAYSDYFFKVPSMYTEISVLNDGSIDIYYRIEFYSQSGHYIDIIDVGFPNVYYDLDSVAARLDGSEITHILKSSVIDIGVEIHLDEVGYIEGDETGMLEVFCHNPKMVYKDIDPEYASVVFYQTWYDFAFTYGSTTRTVRFYLPEALTNIADVQKRVDETSTFTSGSDPLKGSFVEFSTEGTPDNEYRVGIAFPKEYSKVYGKFWTLLIIGNVKAFPGITFFILGIFAICIIVIFSKRREERRYLPPSITSLGGGIREDLSPSEVAILMERPLTQVASLLLFEMMEKGYLYILQKAPLRLRVDISEKEQESLSKYQKLIIKGIGRRNTEDIKVKSGAASGAIPQEPVHQTELKNALADHIKSVAKKMKGFSLRKTRNYYEQIVERAWADMAKAQPELKNAFLWIMVDEHYEEQFEKNYTHYYYPHWYVRNYYFYLGRSSRSIPIATSKAHFRKIESLGKITHISPVRSFMSGVIHKPQTLHSSIRKITRPAATRSSGGRSFGGGGACACACAGGGR